MPNHHKDVIEDSAKVSLGAGLPNHHINVASDSIKASDEVIDSFKKSPILWWVLICAILVFAASLGVYLHHFPGDASTEQAVWGQFGDFMGGLVNPIVCLFTIALLTVSLNQSHLALHQTAQALKQSEVALNHAAAEIALAKQALLDNQKIQTATEVALKQQIDIAAHARDMNNSVSIQNHLQNSVARLDSTPRTIGTSKADRIAGEIATIKTKMGRLDWILEKERLRLVAQYDKS